MEQSLLGVLGVLQEQAVPIVQGGGISADGWKVISFLCAAVAGMFLWLKAKDKQIDDLQKERIADLKENFKRIVDESDKG